MTSSESFYKGECKLQILYIYVDNLDNEEKDRYFEVIEAHKPKDWTYLIFDEEAEAGIENFYIHENLGQVGIKELVEQLRKLIEYLDKNNISWKGNKTGFELTNYKSKEGFLILGPGFIIITKTKFILIYSDTENDIIKQEFSLMKKL